jgi:hypothetical protein
VIVRELSTVTRRSLGNIGMCLVVNFLRASGGRLVDELDDMILIDEMVWLDFDRLHFVTRV